MEYTSRLTWEALLLNEMQVTADLMRSWKTMSEAKNEIMERNLYMYEKEAAIVRRFPFIWRRLSLIDDGEWLNIFLSDVNDGKILALYTIFVDNNLFALVLDQIISEKLKWLSPSLYKSDIVQLFEKLDPYEPSISSQTEKTRAKLCQVILKILKEVWMLNDDRLSKPYISVAVQDYLEKKEKWKEFLYIIQ